MEKVLFTAQQGDIIWRDYVRQLFGRLHYLGPESSQLASNLYSVCTVLCKETDHVRIYSTYNI
jgi:hypothetical protein